MKLHMSQEWDCLIPGENIKGGDKNWHSLWKNKKFQMCVFLYAVKFYVIVIQLVYMFYAVTFYANQMSSELSVGLQRTVL